MNILFISQLYPLSENSKNSFALHYFVKEWKKKHNIQVLRPYLPMEKEILPAENKITIDGVSIDVVKPFWIPLFKIAIVNNSKIINLIIKKPDIIICHLYNSYLTFQFLKKHFNVPLIIGIHRSDVLLAQKFYFRNRIKKALKQADFIAYRSMAIEGNFEKLIPIKKKKTFIAHSGIPEKLIDNAKKLLSSVPQKKRTVIKIISVCRLLKLKQIDKVISALNHLKKEGIKWEYTIIGEGPEENKLEKITLKNQLEKQINFLGQIPRNEVFKELKNHEIFVMPSYNETFGLVFLEAMANGCIVIGAKGWGIDGIVIDGENGFLCDPYNQEEIYESLKKTLTLPENKLNKIRLNSLNTVLDFSDEKMATNYLDKVVLQQ